MLGGTLGTVVHHWFPIHTATPGAYALVGMGATFAGIIRTPVDQRLHDFRVDAGLHDCGPVDDRQHDQLLHLLQAAAKADLRSAE